MAPAETEKNTTVKLTRRGFLEVVICLPFGLALEHILRKLMLTPKTPLQYSVYLPIVSNGEVLNPEVSVRGIGYSPYRDGQDPDWGPPTLGKMKFVKILVF